MAPGDSLSIMNDTKFKKKLLHGDSELNRTDNIDPVLSIFNGMRDRNPRVVENDPKMVIENSIYDFVVEMEKQFDDLFSDIDEIKKQERRRAKRT